ncbi:LysR family transcriptional regulator [Marinobacterium sediminicola]|uniref:DNA-binding transcriptional regulator, LysR family n=1 Tax=Marinobacterium sediminicola TaxID=518898 RepID=A0ABY1S2R0_9GAMM|nr:LysR family transcriptional regulator [Marinobacterium sediminicola]ULG68843.1 LysR family transcriptional regulator [Marinobacterium sediminicola]SMR77547.1 DNA-binding transcriptional regulator, LysR family [Marinobacterium sediminicola]
MIPNQLNVFIAVVKNGNFSAAARQLGVSSAAISKAVAQLEKNLELRLFHRTTHSLTLTEDGHELYKRTGHLVEQLEDQIRLSTDKHKAPHGRLKVNLPDSFGRMVVLPLIPSFLDKYPDIELDLTFDDRIGDLVKEGADVGIGVMLSQDSRLIARDFYPLQPVLVASCEYVEKHGEPETPEQLSGHNCIAYRSSTTGRKKTWNFRVNGELIQIEPRGNLIVNNMSAAMKAVEMGMGIAAVGIGYAETCIEQGCFRRILKEYEADPIQVMIYYSSRHYLPAKTRLFIDHLLEHVHDEHRIDLDQMIHEL